MNQDLVDQFAKKVGKEIQRRLRLHENHQSIKQLAWEMRSDSTLSISVIDANGNRIIEIVLKP